jgi:hypothetical protein
VYSRAGVLASVRPRDRISAKREGYVIEDPAGLRNIIDLRPKKPGTSRIKPKRKAKLPTTERCTITKCRLAAGSTDEECWDAALPMKLFPNGRVSTQAFAPD